VRCSEGLASQGGGRLKRDEVSEVLKDSVIQPQLEIISLKKKDPNK